MPEEGFISVPGGRVWYQSIGRGGVPLLCFHGGPGFTHNYLEPLADLAERRQVIFYDQLGCGNSAVTEPHETSMWTPELYVREVQVIRDALGLERVHHGIPGSELVVFEESSHMSQAEEPEAVLDLVRGFLVRVESGS